VDEPTRKGFVYVTLSDHPEQGEEGFLITHHSEGAVRFQVRAFSRPGSALVAATGPLNRWAQSLATTRYERAIRALVNVA
jgi:uncharacterized protein (UPF0548 family)